MIPMTEQKLNNIMLGQQNGPQSLNFGGKLEKKQSVGMSSAARSKVSKESFLKHYYGRKVPVTEARLIQSGSAETLSNQQMTTDPKTEMQIQELISKTVAPV